MPDATQTTQTGVPIFEDLLEHTEVLKILEGSRGKWFQIGPDRFVQVGHRTGHYDFRNGRTELVPDSFVVDVHHTVPAWGTGHEVTSSTSYHFCSETGLKNVSRNGLALRGDDLEDHHHPHRVLKGLTPESECAPPNLSQGNIGLRMLAAAESYDDIAHAHFEALGATPSIIDDLASLRRRAS